jgi:hypothetical protein
MLYSGTILVLVTEPHFMTIQVQFPGMNVSAHHIPYFAPAPPPQSASQDYLVLETRVR